MLLWKYGLCVHRVWAVYCASWYDHQGIVKKNSSSLNMFICSSYTHIMEQQANTDFLFELLTTVAKTHECSELFMEPKQRVMCMPSNGLKHS